MYKYGNLLIYNQLVDCDNVDDHWQQLLIGIRSIELATKCNYSSDHVEFGVEFKRKKQQITMTKQRLVDHLSAYLQFNRNKRLHPTLIKTVNSFIHYFHLIRFWISCSAKFSKRKMN